MLTMLWLAESYKGLAVWLLVVTANSMTISKRHICRQDLRNAFGGLLSTNLAGWNLISLVREGHIEL
jgi:hypothetical protein